MVKKNKNDWLIWVIAIVAIVALVLSAVAIHKANITGQGIFDLFKKIETTSYSSENFADIFYPENILVVAPPGYSYEVKENSAVLLPNNAGVFVRPTCKGCDSCKRKGVLGYYVCDYEFPCTSLECSMEIPDDQTNFIKIQKFQFETYSP